MKIKQIRRIVRALLKVPIDRREPHAKVVSAQDALEFAAMLLGIKPVFLLGRGFDDQAWISAMRQTALDLGVGFAEDVYWNVDDSKIDMPAWFRDLRITRERAPYVSAASGALSEIRQISARGWVTPVEEARLLGYPKCCVEDYHHRALVTDETFFRAVMRIARGE